MAGKSSSLATTLLSLPPEIIHQILQYLEPCDLYDTARTCRALYPFLSTDSFWQSFVHQELTTRLSTPPGDSFRELYTSLHSLWFLARNGIWFSDDSQHGRLLFARYDPRRACIEAYRIVAERGDFRHGTLDWGRDGHVVYHTFHPKVQLDLNQPVLRFDAVNGLHSPSMADYKIGDPIRMDIHPETTTCSTFMHARSLEDTSLYSGSQVWPPRLFPAPKNQRVRNASSTAFSATGHKPSKSSEISESAFRIRKWVQYRQFHPAANFERTPGIGNILSTYGTIPKEYITPTKEKPWQGVWCGDYSAHGCEFLAIVQPDGKSWSLSMPRKARKAFNIWPRTREYLLNDISERLGIHMEGDDDDPDLVYGDDTEDDDADDEELESVFIDNVSSTSASQEEAPYNGQLYAIKLTGDPNVPRGEITFIAEDLGSKGFIGNTNESIFSPGATESSGNCPYKLDIGPEGPRIVRSVGHIASLNFTGDGYVPSQLILMSENRLAQYMRPFGYVSFYERVDLTKFLKHE